MLNVLCKFVGDVKNHWECKKALDVTLHMVVIRLCYMRRLLVHVSQMFEAMFSKGIFLF